MNQNVSNILLFAGKIGDLKASELLESIKECRQLSRNRYSFK